MPNPRETIFNESGEILFGPEDYIFGRLNWPGWSFVRGGKSYTVVSSEWDPERGTITTVVKQ